MYIKQTAKNFSGDKKYCFIYFLRESFGLEGYDMAEHFFGYARSTVKNYCYKGKRIIITEAMLKEFNDCIKYNGFIVGNVEYEDESMFGFLNNIPLTYICEIYGEGKLLFLKPGKTIHLNTRMKSHAKNSSYGSDYVKVRQVFDFNNEETAEFMEKKVIKYYKEKYGDAYIRNDRFKEIPFDEEDLKELYKIYEKVKMIEED